MDQRVGNVCGHNVVTVRRGMTVAEAAALMRKHHVGTVVMQLEAKKRVVA